MVKSAGESVGESAGESVGERASGSAGEGIADLPKSLVLFRH